ncbi:MAG: hypothetical protein R6V50_00195 [Thermoplasmatota archaeon]
MKKITAILREYVVVLSIILMIFGCILMAMGVLWYWFEDVVVNADMLQIVEDLADWNGYILVAGVIIFAFGLYYMYSYMTKRKFVLEEIQTNKRSEFLKNHKKVKNTVKHLPVKYQKMVQNKEEELAIK